MQRRYEGTVHKLCRAYGMNMFHQVLSQWCRTLPVMLGFGSPFSIEEARRWFNSALSNVLFFPRLSQSAPCFMSSSSRSQNNTCRNQEWQMENMRISQWNDHQYQARSCFESANQYFLQSVGARAQLIITSLVIGPKPESEGCPQEFRLVQFFETMSTVLSGAWNAKVP